MERGGLNGNCTYCITNIYFVGHSVGGDIGTLLCDSDIKNIIKKFINIEGDITQYDDFITREACEAEKKGAFNDWFYNRLMNDLVLNQWGREYQSVLRYYKSLKLCRIEAFKSTALELRKLKNALKGKYTSIIGDKYISLKIPKIFIYGKKSIDKRSIDFLKNNNLEYKEYENAGHWVMIDEAEDFYSFLYKFIS